MRPTEDAAGQELPSAKLPRRLPSVPKATPLPTGGSRVLRPSALDQLLAPAVQSRAQQQLFPGVPAPPVVQPQVQQQQPVLQVAPAPSPLINFNSGPDLSALFQQQPLAVQVAPQQQPVVIAGQPVADGGWMDGTFPVSPWVIDEREAAQQVVDQAKTADRARLRKDYEATDRTEITQELTPKQWASLSPLQQAAAQANYDLSLAVKKDFDTQGKYKADDTQTKSYNDRVTALFGDEESLGYKGLDYAPNTLAFLDSRGIEVANLAGRTLDDMLSGNALMTTETFNALGEQVKSPDVFHTGPTDARGNNIQFAQQLAKGQLAYQEGLAAKLKQGGQLLTDITSASTNRDATKSYGALASSPEQIKLTDVRPGTLAQLDKYMQALALPDAPIDKALEAINLDLQERGASAKEAAQVWEGMIERSRKAVTGEVPWFSGIDFPMRSPAEVAQALGVPILKRQATQGAE